MAYRHNKDADGSCSRMGKSAEERFVKALDSLSFSFEEATLEGQFQHKDFHVGLDASVDVKSRKRISRADADSQDDLVWIEFKNGRGHRGWLRGKATWIAFEVESGFVVFHRESLLEYAEEAVDFSTRASTPKDAVHKLYPRGLAELSLLPMNELREKLPHIHIKST